MADSHLPNSKRGNLTPRRKLALIRQVEEGRFSVSEACRKVGISRKTFYKWRERYDTAQKQEQAPLAALSPKKRTYHRRKPRPTDKLVPEVTETVKKDPTLSAHGIAKLLRISSKGVWGVLKRLGLSREKQRKGFKAQYIPQRSLPPRKKLALIRRVESGELSASQACREYGVSRKTFYKWRSRYHQALAEKRSVLVALSPKEKTFDPSKRHANSSPNLFIQEIMEVVKRNPSYSVHEVACHVSLSAKGVWGVLKKLGLSKETERRRFQRLYLSFRPWLAVIFTIEYFLGSLIIPEIPLISPLLAVIPKRRRAAALYLPLLVLVFGAGWKLNQALFVTQPDLFGRIGLVLSEIALIFGLFFFLYSVKYYLTLTLVLLFSRGAGNGANGILNGLRNGLNNGLNGLNGRFNGRLNGRLNGLWSGRLNGLNGLRSGFNGLSPFAPPQRGYGGSANGLNNNHLPPEARLAKGGNQIKLRDQPFISIHLPFYNEKRVAGRILEACSRLNYPNFEVLVLDDSNDGTTGIVEEWTKRDPRIRLVHRPNREGWKGGALKYALAHMDPRAQFVVVLDADFIPFPDTLDWFLRYFHFLAGGLRNVAKSRIAAVQGYQWHVLNKDENWITRGIRGEYAGSYIIERSGTELFGSLKQIAGSVYMIRADLLKEFGWGTSITEDFQLTLRLYEAGYKVIYTPYIQAPAECVSTLKRLIRQRMRWAEGHTHNIRKMFPRLWYSPRMNLTEKLEFLYLSPYYLQSLFFLVGTIAWLLADVVFRAKLPFWTATWGWALVFTNMLSLIVMNAAGMFIEESDRGDYKGLLSFIATTYIVVPFQAYAAIKGLFEKEEGHWFRTPKTGLITIELMRGHFARLFGWLFPRRAGERVRRRLGRNFQISTAALQTLKQKQLALLPAYGFSGATHRLQRTARKKLLSRGIISLLLIGAILLNYASFFAPPAALAQAEDPKIEQQINIIDQEYSTTQLGDNIPCSSANPQPTDNSLGIVKFDPAKYSSETLYFEAVVKHGSGSWTRKRSSSFSLPSVAKEYTVRIYELKTFTGYYEAKACLYNITDNTFDADVATTTLDLSSATTYTQAARIIITQQDATMIDDTVTQIEIGDAQTFSNTTYASLTDPKYWYYDSSKYDNLADVTGIYLEATNLDGQQPSKVMIGDGRLFITGGAVIETSGGVKYAIFVAAGVLEVWKNIDGTPSLVDSDTAATVHGILAFIEGVHAIMRSDGNISLFSVGRLGTRDVAHAIFNTTTDTIGAWENVAAYTSGLPMIYACWGVAKSDGKIGVLYIDLVKVKGINYTQIKYNEHSGVAWGTPELVNTNTQKNYYEPRITCCPANDLEAFYYCTTDGDPTYRRRNATWGTETAYAETTATIGAVVCTTGDTPYRYHVAGQSIEENNVDTAYDTDSVYKDVSAALANSTRYAFYIDTSDDVHLISNSGAGWTDEGALQAGTYRRVIAEWAYNNEHQSGEINYIFDDGMNVYYSSFITGSNGTSQIALYQTGGTKVAGSEITTDGDGNWERDRSSDFKNDANFTSGQTYEIRVLSTAGWSDQIANAKIIIEQDASGSGLTTMELIHQYINTKTTNTGTYADTNFDNRYDSENWEAGTFTHAFEATLRNNGGTSGARMDPDVSASVTGSASYSRQRDTVLDPLSDNTNYDTQLQYADASTSWLIIQVSSLQIPERVIFLLPLVIFLPKVVEWFRRKYTLIGAKLR